jgi:hypothetical protein
MEEGYRINLLKIPHRGGFLDRCISTFYLTKEEKNVTV